LAAPGGEEAVPQGGGRPPVRGAARSAPAPDLPVVPLPRAERGAVVGPLDRLVGGHAARVPDEGTPAAQRRLARGHAHLIRRLDHATPRGLKPPGEARLPR